VLRAGGPGEGDDSKETNIAVALLTTDTTDAMADRESRLKIIIGIWREG